jgi:hypothetical protein
VINQYYVDQAAKGNTDGSSWKNADTTVYHALDVFNHCPDALPMTIQIAKGIYQQADANTPFSINKPNGIFLGGYPTGGGTRNAAVNAVTWHGDLHASKSAQVDGIRLQK